MDAVYVFRIDAEPADDGCVVLRLRGALDAHTTPELEYELSRSLAGRPRLIVLDLAEVTYISSAGFGALLDGLHGCRDERSDLRIAAMPPGVARVFGILGLRKVFEPFDTVAAAIAGARGAP
ncbi:MAG: STAS domain-containing protein [Candidatus Sericytochromatia bacterium]|nr:STAS domain-containing protein [Candidatus Tanganyikabacteria bacterium]